jgi:curli biogenesis system outer membrane secretion channel CsgG
VNRFFALLALILMISGAASAAPREVEVEATGPTTQDAITQGLVQALEQVSGVSLVAAQAARTELASQVNGDQTASELTQEQQSTTLKVTGGIVSAYRVISSTSGSPVTVRLAVTVEVFEPKGLGNQTRRRIAVATFATPSARSGRTAALLRERITAHLVQARRFAVLDRTEGAVYAQEMALLQSGNAPLTERTRVGQVIGADYVVTGALRETAAKRSDKVLELSGEVVTSTTPGSAEADYQVIEIATRQIKWAGTFRFAGDDAVDRIGAKIADEITQTIFPMRLIKFEDPANLIVNQGADSLRTGQRFRAMVLGEMMTDPYTREPLGQSEEEAGVVEIKRVDAKLSYAQLVSGHLPSPRGDEVQIVLRPATLEPAHVRAKARAIARDAPSITELPFDR